LKLPASFPFVEPVTVQEGEETTRVPAVKVQLVSVGLNPVPVTVTVVAGAPPGADPVPIWGEPLVGLNVMKGVTRNGKTDAESAGVTVDVTFTVYCWPGALAETMKEPATSPVPPIEQVEDAIKPVGVEDQVQAPASAIGKGVGVPVTVMVSPAFPLAALSVITARTAFAGGIAIEEIEMNNAEVSSITKNREPTVRVVNSEHATMISQAYINNVT
jgi:hypothetical protein